MMPVPMDGQEPSRTLMVAWMFFITALLSYLMVSSSAEFRAFAPIATEGYLLSIAALVGGLIVPFLGRGVRYQVLAVTALASIPSMVYGVALVALPVLLGGSALVSILVFWALQRVVVYWLILAFFSACGLLLGIGARVLV